MLNHTVLDATFFCRTNFVDRFLLYDLDHRLNRVLTRVYFFKVDEVLNCQDTKVVLIHKFCVLGTVFVHTFLIIGQSCRHTLHEGKAYHLVSLSIHSSHQIDKFAIGRSKQATCVILQYRATFKEESWASLCCRSNQFDSF